jgi:hypothetical protein
MFMSNRVESENYRWQDLYRAAILETEQTKLAERIAHAEWAIIVRWHGLSGEPESALEERRALDAALDALRMLKGYSRRATAA